MTSKGPSRWRNSIVGYSDEDPASLLPHPFNPKLHPKAQQDALTGSISELGWLAPVVVNDTTGHTIDGHARIEIAISRGEPTVPVAHVRLSEDAERLAVATFDPVGSLAVLDNDNLAALLEGLTSADEAVANLLRDLAPPKVKNLNPDDADLTPPAEPVTRPGDLWLLGDHRLLCEDNQSPEVLRRLFDGVCARLVVTSPPYNQNIDTFRPSGMQIEHPAWAERMASAYEDSKPEDAYQSDQVAMLDGLWDLTTSDASVFYNHKHRYRDIRVISPMIWVLRSRWALRQEIIWDRTSSLTLNARMFMPSDERLYWLFKGNGFVFQDTPEIKAWSTVWRIPARNEEQVSAPFANEIAERPITACTDPGDWVYDPYAGSGTVLVSCERLGRRGLATEVSPAYCDVIVQRWERVTGRKATLERQAVEAHA